MITTLDHIPQSKYSLKAPYLMVPEYITIHNTYNDASAKNEVSYMKNNSSPTGYHVAIDDIEARIAIPYTRNAYHAGDGQGVGNRKSIGIEICYSKSGGPKYVKAEENTVEFVAELLMQYNWDISRIKKHEDWSGKHCPHRILDEKRWDSFKQRIKLKLDEMKGGNDMSQAFSPGSKTLVDASEAFLVKAVKDGVIQQVHVDDYKKGKMTTDKLLGLKVLIDNERAKGVK